MSMNPPCHTTPHVRSRRMRLSNLLKRAGAAVAIASLSAPTIAAVRCDMQHGFDQPDQAGKRTLPVWKDGEGRALLFADAMNVNTDGTRRSYSVEDFWGEKRAINNLCNAMSDACRGLDGNGKKQRRILTQQASAAHWPPQLLAQTRISPSIIPMPGGRPCPEVDGYLVSATSLHRAHISDACDLSNYVDAEKVPAIVIPKGKNGFSSAKTAVGDLAVAMSADGKTLLYAVVGDTGPVNELGEISVALAGQLLGKTGPPANYNEIRGRPPYQGKAWTVGRTFVLVFPNSGRPSDPYMDAAAVDAVAARLFSAWGGAERLKSCAAQYR